MPAGNNGILWPFTAIPPLICLFFVSFSPCPSAQDLDLKTGEPCTQPDEFWLDVAQKLMMTQLQVGRGGGGQGLGPSEAGDGCMVELQVGMAGGGGA